MNNKFSLELDTQNQTDNILALYKDMALDGDSQVIQCFSELNFPVNGRLASNEYSFFRVNQLSYDKEYPKREAMENVLLSIDNEAYNFVYILTGTKQGVELCLGVVKNGNEHNTLLNTKLSAANYCENVAKAFEGNFNGSKLEKIKGDALADMAVYSTDKYRYAGVVRGVPSIDEKEAGSDEGFQGIDRLINSMLGQEWRLVIVCEPVQKEKILEIKSDVYDFYNRMSVWAKSNIQRSQSFGTSTTTGSSTSDTKGKNTGVSTSEGTTTSKGHSSGDSDSSSNSSKGTSSTKGTSKSVSESHTYGTSNSKTENSGSSQAVTIEKANKAVQEMMSFIDDELLKRLKIGASKRMFNTSVIYMADNPTNANRLKVGLMSLFQGNDPSYSPLHANSIDLDDADNRKTLSIYQNRTMYTPDINADIMTLLSRPFSGTQAGAGTYLTAREVSLLAGLPQKEVPGITLKESVGFGLNANICSKNNSVKLGCLMQQGRILHDTPFYVDNKVLSKHIFVAGVTRSGKTTTCHTLLHEINNSIRGKKIPFMVIEPAKTEYRTLVRNAKEFGDVAVFTLGKESVAPFRLNPFELVEGELITSHVDILKAAFTSAFPMEASMPQLLEEAIYNCYEAMGWDIETNEYLRESENGNPFQDRDVDAFPQLSDLLQALREVVDNKDFGTELKQNYIGSLVSRLSTLVLGAKGLMLNCPRSVDFSYLARNNVVLELEDIKSGEEKAFIMGLVLSRMAAVIKKEYLQDNEYRHVTLIEEAHRLLSKVEYGDSGAKKNAVETFTDLLAEVGKYGEGMIIVDQIPNKLTSEVLKNTNTKIIHRIFARDDKEVVGDTMLMNDKQKEYLSSLDVGDAIIFTEHTDNPVNVHIDKIVDTSEKAVMDEEVENNFLYVREQLGNCYNDVIGMPILKKYGKLYSNLKKINDKSNGAALIRDINRQYKEICGYMKFFSTNNFWQVLVARGNIINGTRFTACCLSFKAYQAECMALSDFLASRPDGDISEKDLVEYSNKIHLIT